MEPLLHLIILVVCCMLELVQVMPHLGALADFRGAVRGMARQVGVSLLLKQLIIQMKICLPGEGN